MQPEHTPETSIDNQSKVPHPESDTPVVMSGFVTYHEDYAAWKRGYDSQVQGLRRQGAGKKIGEMIGRSSPAN